MGGVGFFLKIREIEGFVKDRPALISFPPDIQISGSVEPLGPLGFAELKEGFPREAGLASFEKASLRMPYVDLKGGPHPGTGWKHLDSRMKLSPETIFQRVYSQR